MNFNQAIKNLNRSLFKKQPLTFNHSWVKNNVRKSYNFIVENIRTESGETDWDNIVRRLDHQNQKLWLKGKKIKKNIDQYKNRAEVEAILTKYQKKLYTFLVQKNKEDKQICDLISIRLVRTAQKGNLLARQKAKIFIKHLVDQWIDGRYFKHWRGYDDLIEKNIERCIRRYRYSGSFIVYLYRTLEYAGRGLRMLEAFSLDDYIPETTKRKSENLVYDSRTGETRLYSSKKHRR
ncbi:MAG: hypothetical protein WC735_04645 [Candidatus Paceibacterota bacterium]|jgi:hypothetical protein